MDRVAAARHPVDDIAGVQLDERRRPARRRCGSVPVRVPHHAAHRQAAPGATGAAMTSLVLGGLLGLLFATRGTACCAGRSADAAGPAGRPGGSIPRRHLAAVQAAGAPHGHRGAVRRGAPDLPARPALLVGGWGGDRARTSPPASRSSQLLERRTQHLRRSGEYTYSTAGRATHWACADLRAALRLARRSVHVHPAGEMMQPDA
jgi:hypothetical protein